MSPALAIGRTYSVISDFFSAGTFSLVEETEHTHTHPNAKKDVVMPNSEVSDSHSEDHSEWINNSTFLPAERRTEQSGLPSTQMLSVAKHLLLICTRGPARGASGDLMQVTQCVLAKCSLNEQKNKVDAGRVNKTLPRSLK